MLVVLLAVAAGVWYVRSDALSPGDGGGGAADDTSASGLQKAPGLQGSTPTPTSVAGAHVTGTVRHHGAPAPARVTLWPLARLGPTQAFSSDAPSAHWRRLDPIALEPPHAVITAKDDGSFAFPSVPRGQYQLVAEHAHARATLQIDVRAATPCHHLLTLRDGAHTVRGTVHDEDGRPWQGHVRVEPFAHETEHRGVVPGQPALAAVDEHGNFEVQGVVRGRARVYLHLPGAYDARVETIWIPTSRPLALVAPTTAWLPGQVIAEDDRTPVRGAVIVSTSELGERHVLFRAVSDGEGRFRIPKLPGDDPDPHFVHAEGFTPIKRRVPPNATRVLWPLARAGTLRGRVVTPDEHAQRDGISIVAFPGRSPRFWRWTATTDADGRFTIPNVGAGPVSVMARGHGMVHRGPPLSWDWPLQVVVPAGGTADVVLELRRVPGVPGSIRDEHGKPVVGARLRASHPDWSEEHVGGLTLSAATSGDDGTFVLAELIPDREYDVEVFVEGRRPIDVELERGQNRLDVRLAAEQWIEVRVLGPEGPLPDATVEAFSRSPATLATTDDRGVARMGPLEIDDTIWVNCQARGFVTADHHFDEGSFPATVRLEPAMQIRGRVTYWGGEPAVDVSVGARHVASDESPPDTRTDDDGHFVLADLAPGSYRVWADISHMWGWGNTEVDAQAGDHDVRMRAPAHAPVPDEADTHPPPPPAWVEVKIVDGAGVPVPTANCVWIRAGHPEWADVYGGHVRIPADASGITVWAATTSAGVPLPLGRVELDALPADATIRLPPALSIDGVVEDQAGRAVHGATVRAVWPNGQRHDAITGPGGVFRIPFLEPGSYAVHVRAHGDVLANDPRTIAAGTTDVRLRVRRGAHAAITVVDPQGEPVFDAHVELLDDEEKTVETDAIGVGMLRGLDPERTYILRVTPSWKHRHLTAVTRKGWAPAATVVRLPPGLTVTGVVRTPDDEPVPNIYITYGEGDVEADDQGRFEIQGLAPGPVTLRARFGRHARLLHGTADHEVASGESEPLTVQAGTGDVVLRIDPLATLTLRIPWQGTGDPEVTLRPQGRTRARAATARWKDGVASFRYVPRKKRYDAWMGNLPGGRYALARGLAPGEHTLRVEQGGTIRGVVRGIPSRATELRVFLDDPLVEVRTAPNPDGAFELVGVPQGPWKVRARCFVEARDYVGSVQASNGDVVTITLEPATDDD